MAHSIRLSDDRYLAALKRFLAKIEAGTGLRGYDCPDEGVKATECSWGLCSLAKEDWPDASDHLWPEDFPERVAPKYLEEHQTCPLDWRKRAGINGCYYTCRFFQGKDRLTREEAIELYRAAILRAAK